MALKKLVSTPDLVAYKLNKSLVGVLHRFDKMRDYMIAGGHAPPKALRLFRSDFADIDRAVREQSEGRFNADTVNYNGLPIIRHDDDREES